MSKSHYFFFNNKTHKMWVQAIAGEKTYRHFLKLADTFEVEI
jgi:hypothetical protein